MSVTFLTNEDETRIQKQISELSEQINDLDSTELRKYVEEQMGEVAFEENLTEAFDFFVGFLNKNGNTVTNSYGGVTDFIPVEIGDVFIWSGASDINGSNGVCEYDKDKNFIKGYPLVEQSYKFTRNVKYTVTEGAFVRFSTMTQANEGSLIKTKEYDGISELKNKTDEYLIGAETDKFLNYKNGKTLDGAGGMTTSFIKAKENDVFLVTCFTQYSVAGICFYDVGKNILQANLYNDISTAYERTREKAVAPPRTAYVRFSTLDANGHPFKVWKYEQLTSKHADYNLYEYIKELRNSNVLFGKKYVACGDSFTEGDFPEKTEENWDEKTGEYKTYCWHIADRNKMTLVNEAICGSTMYNNGNIHAFSLTRYTQIPTDSDYITLCFGLNETNAPIGTLQDTTNETVMGAWNIVLEYLITNMPYAKIGIIIPDAWLTSALREALIDIAEYWGVPYLDLRGDTKVPMLIGGRLGTTVSAKARDLRNEAFQVSAEDSHPNPKAHLYRSSIIENFLRSL